MTTKSAFSFRRTATAYLTSAACPMGTAFMYIATYDASDLGIVWRGGNRAQWFWRASVNDTYGASGTAGTRAAAAEALLASYRAEKVRAGNLASHFRAAYRFFRKHAGGIVGRNAETALHLARAEAHAETQGWAVEWKHDDAGSGDHNEWCAKARRMVRAAGWSGWSCEHEILCALLRESDGRPLASLGAIIDPSRDYARVVAAELALEAMQPESPAPPSKPPVEVTPGPNDLVCDISEYYRRDFGADGSLPDSLSYGAVNPANYPGRSGKGQYFAPSLLGGSDYSGTLVHVSNHRVFCDAFKAGQGVWWSDLYGGHGTFGVLIDPKRIPADVATEVNDFLGGLESYCIASDDDHSALETEKQDEAWESSVRDEFRRELETQHDCDLSAVDGDALFELFRTASDTTNVYWENQSGSDMYIDVERIADKVTADEVKALPGYKASDV